MALSGYFSTISRIFQNIAMFGLSGLSLSRGKIAKKEAIKKYYLKGIKHPLFLRSNTSDYATFSQVFIEKQYDFEFHSNPKVIIDCGANIGLASLFFANKYPDARIIAVEPEKSNYEILIRNTQEYKNIECLNVGIWNKTTNLEIIDAGLGKWGFITKEVTYSNENTIAAVTLTDILNKYGFTEVDIVKMDIEGAELKVFSDGYQDWLGKTKWLIIELHDRMQKGTSKAFFDAVSTFEYSIDIKGENIFCELNSTAR